MFAQLTLVGRLGADPVLRFLSNGNPVTTFSLATSEKYKDNETTTWFRVSVFGGQAEACNQYLSKGRPVLVIGRLNPDKETGSPKVFERRDGTSGASYEVNAINVRFLPGGGNEQPNGTTESAANDGIPF
jgi:single-strand DNA-binding protein